MGERSRAGGKVGAEAGRRPEQVPKTAPCQVHCPGGADIRGWVTTVAQREKLGLSSDEAYAFAWNTIVDRNPFPGVMGRICPHPCESGCNRHGKDAAVSINQMERFIGDWGLRAGLSLPLLESEAKPESIGVVGAGPAGLSFAYQMARRGYEVTVYEGYPKAGGMLRYGIPVYRLPEEVLDGEIQRIVDLGVKLSTDTRIGRDVSLEQLEERHDCIFLGIGAHKGRLLGIPGESGPGVWTGTDYLSRFNRGEPVSLGRRVAVIGGGNTAIDAARAARRSGAEVTILYRRTRTEMPAIEQEVAEALEEGIAIRYLVAPVEIIRSGGVPEALLLEKMALGPPDESGRRRPTPVAGSEHRIAVDSVIAAIAQDPDWTNLDRHGVAAGALRDGPFEVVDDLYWVAGDVVNPGIAGSAIANGRMAAESLHARLRGLPAPDFDRPEPIGVGAVKLDSYAEKPRSETSVRPISERLEDPEAEVHPGLSEAQFLAEAERCLSCGLCFGCERCWMYCVHGGFARLEDARPGAYFAVSADRCQVCGKCIDLCPCGFLQIQEPEGPA